MNKRLGTDIDDSIEKTVMHEIMNNVNNYCDYYEIRTNHTPIPETITSEDTPKQSEEPITDEDETTIATTTEENETTTTNEERTSRPRKTKTTLRH